MQGFGCCPLHCTLPVPGRDSGSFTGGGDGGTIAATSLQCSSGVVLGRTSNGTGAVEELTASSSGAVILDDALHAWAVGDLVGKLRSLLGSSNIIGLWLDRSLSGNTVTDVSGNGRHGTYASAPTTWGRWGLARVATIANADNNYWSVADADAFSFGNGTTDSAFSVVALLRPDTLTTARRIVWAKYDAYTGTGREYDFGYSGSVFSARLWDHSTGGYIGQMTSAVPVTEGTWQVLAMTYSGAATASGVKLYHNAALVTTTNYTSGSYVAMENLTTAPGTWYLTSGNTLGYMTGERGLTLLVAGALSAEQLTVMQPWLLGYVGAL